MKTRIEVYEIKKACAEVLSCEHISGRTKEVVEECCRRISSRKQKDQNRYVTNYEKFREYYLANKERICDNNKKYYKEHINERQQYGRDYSRNYRLKIKEGENNGSN